MTLGMFNEHYLPVISGLGWGVDVLEDNNSAGDNDSFPEIELRKHSPAGEDFSFIVSMTDLVRAIDEYAEDFDCDEHVKMWIGAECDGMSGVPPIKTLVEDSVDIQSMLLELAEAVRDVEVDVEEELEGAIEIKWK